MAEETSFIFLLENRPIVFWSRVLHMRVSICVSFRFFGPHQVALEVGLKYEGMILILGAPRDLGMPQKGIPQSPD